MNLGLLATNADNCPYEALRIESICRRFDVAAAVGVSSDALDGLVRAGDSLEALDGLVRAGDSLEALFNGRVVWGFAAARERLATVPGIMLRRMVIAGPAFGMECHAGTGVHFESSEWSLDAFKGTIRLTSRLLRSLGFEAYDAGGRGALIKEPCACGSNDIPVEFNDKR